MTDKIIVILCVLAIVIVVVGCSVKSSGDSRAHFECLRQGIASERGLTYMRIFNTDDVVCVYQVEVPIQMEE